MLKEPRLNLQKKKALEASAYCRFCATKWFNIHYIGVRVRLTEASSECRFILQ